MHRTAPIPYISPERPPLPIIDFATSPYPKPVRQLALTYRQHGRACGYNGRRSRSRRYSHPNISTIPANSATPLSTSTARAGAQSRQSERGNFSSHLVTVSSSATGTDTAGRANTSRNPLFRLGDWAPAGQMVCPMRFELTFDGF